MDKIEMPMKIVDKIRQRLSDGDFALCTWSATELVESRDALIRADERQKAAERQRELLEAARAFQALNVCYRVGKTPSEALFRRIEKATAAIMAEPEEAHS